MTHNFDNTRDLNTMEGIGFKVPDIQKVTNQMWGWLENRLECIAALLHFLGIFLLQAFQRGRKEVPCSRRARLHDFEDGDSES